MSETPRTDAISAQCYSKHGDFPFPIIMEHARQLERELSQLKVELQTVKALTERSGCLLADYEQLKRERDEPLKDKERLDFAILYPHKFIYLMETRAHGGFVEQELKKGRQAIDAAINSQQIEK